MKRRRHTPEQIIRKLAEGEKLLGEGKTHRGGLPAPRDHRVDLAPLAEPVRRHEGRRRQEAQGARAREPAPEAHRGRPGPRHRHAEGAEPGKLLTPDRRRRAVVALREQFGVTERRACRVVGQPRSTQRLAPPVPTDDELALRAFLRDFSRRRPRWGWRRAAGGGQAGRLAGQPQADPPPLDAEGLRVPYRKRKKPAPGHRRAGRGHVPDPAQRRLGHGLPVRPDRETGGCSSS